MKHLIFAALLALPTLAGAVCPSPGSMPTCQDCRITFSWALRAIASAELTGKPNGLPFTGWSLYTDQAPKVRIGDKATVNGSYSSGAIQANLSDEAGLLANAAEVVVWVAFVKRGLGGKIVAGPCEYGQKVAYRASQPIQQTRP